MTMTKDDTLTLQMTMTEVMLSNSNKNPAQQKIISYSRTTVPVCLHPSPPEASPTSQTECHLWRWFGADGCQILTTVFPTLIFFSFIRKDVDHKLEIFNTWSFYCQMSIL